MNAEQKRAWFALAVCGAACTGFAVLALIFRPEDGFTAFAILALLALSGRIGRGEKADERDRSIARRAMLAGAKASYLAFIAGCMGVWLVTFECRGQEQITVHVLADITWVGGIVFVAVRSVAALVLYGRHVEADDA